MARVRYAVSLIFLFLVACASQEEVLLPTYISRELSRSLTVFDPEQSAARPDCAPITLEEKTEEDCDTAEELAGWTHIGPPNKKRTRYTISPDGGRRAIKAEGVMSASGLIRRVSINPYECPLIEWEWRADKVQKNANLRTKEGDDVTASVGITFGDPGFLVNITRRPTIRYVWTNGYSVLDESVLNPHVDVVQSIVVRNEPNRVGTWVHERRNILDDYRRVFGGEPRHKIAIVGLFTDNDGTKEPVEAQYGKIWFLCGTETAWD